MTTFNEEPFSHIQILKYYSIITHHLTYCKSSIHQAFLALLHSANPERCQYQPCSTPEESLGRAFQLAEDIYGVSPILDAKNKSCCTDEKSVMTYLAELFKVGYVFFPDH